MTPYPSEQRRAEDRGEESKQSRVGEAKRDALAAGFADAEAVRATLIFVHANRLLRALGRSPAGKLSGANTKDRRSPNREVF